LKDFIALLLLLLWGSINGQTPKAIFQPISLDQGHVNDLMRDSEGFIWISTQDGLTKYNGTHFIQYNYDRKDEYSLAQNYVWQTFEDSRKNIWIGLFGGGLCRYDKQKDLFHRYDDFGTIADHGIRSFDQLDDSTLVVGTDHGLYLYDLDSFSFIEDSTFIAQQFAQGMVHSHDLEVHGEDVIITGENGGYIATPRTKQVIPIDTSILQMGKIGFVQRLENGHYLFSDMQTFVEAKYSPESKHFHPIHSLSHNLSIVVNDVSPGKDDQILVASESGLFTLNIKDKSLQAIPHDQPEMNNLVDKVAYCIAEVEPDLKWIGTKTNIYAFSERKRPFHQILSDQLCGSAILGMTEDREGNLWVATRRGLGRILNFQKTADQWKYICYDQETNPELRNAYILNVKPIGNQLLVGYRKKGFSILDVQQNTKVRFLNPPQAIDALTKNGSVSNFLLDSKNNVWISTSGNGVVKWPLNDPEKVHQYINEDGKSDILSHNYTFGFEEINEDWIAVATASGITMIHQSRDTTYQIHSSHDSLSLSGNFIMDFHRDHNNQLWVCTDGGVNLWKRDNTFTSWTKNDGLPNDVIYGMLEHENELWVSSNKGLTRIQNTSPPGFKTFSTDDDVLNEEHNQFSFYRTQSGHLLFGGKAGITRFDPSEIMANPIDATPVIESFLLFNKTGSDRIENHINYTDKLVLDHDENFLSFELSSLSHYKSNQNQYRYRLSPLNEEWIEIGSRNFISLNGLAPGTYTLSIQSSNNDGIWGSTTKDLEIIINRPIYTRWYAWLSYALILLGIVYIFYRMRVNHITHLAKAREEERTKIRERSAKDFHDEVGSLITKLSLLNQYLLSDMPQDARENISILHKMQSNIQRIRTGMKDFIWVLDPNKDALESTIIKIREIGNDLFEHTGIKFQCQVSDKVQTEMPLNGVQRRQLVLLLKEAFHNIVKHAEAKVCRVQIDQKNTKLIVIIRDDGRGFDTSDYKPGYGIKSIRERARKMNGKLTIESTLEDGTILTVFMPTHPDGL